MCKSSQLRSWSPVLAAPHPLTPSISVPARPRNSLLASTHYSPRAGEPSRPPPASAGHSCPAGPGARASPAPDMDHAPSPRRPRGVHRPRRLRCWVQETACLWREKQKGTVGSTVFRALHATAPGPFPPPPRPSSNSTPGKLGFESSLGGRCERDARAGRGRAGTPAAERPKGPPPTSASPPHTHRELLGVPSSRRR